MRIIHSIDSVAPKSFGLGPVALNLVREQNSLGQDSVIWSLDNIDDACSAGHELADFSKNIRVFSRSWPLLLGYSLNMENAAKVNSNDCPQIVHQHGIWTGRSRTTNILREKIGVKSVITPHGSLQKWALKKSHGKKRLALSLYENENLTKASCLHAVSTDEINDIRDFGLDAPVAMIPNGISQQWLNSSGDSFKFRENFGISIDTKILLFLSRITPKKGLPMLLEAIASIKSDFLGWTLVIVGSDEFGHKVEVVSVIEKLGLQSDVIFTGPLHGSSKRDAFAAAELFVLPSYSEGAPIVILEALGAGVPVVATKASSWRDLESYACGWLCDIERDALAQALKVALCTNSLELSKMGTAGKKLVSRAYSWRQSAEMTIQLYEWLLHGGTCPKFVSR